MTKGLVLGRSSTPPRPTLHNSPGFGQEKGGRGLAPTSSSSSACRPQDSAPPALTHSSLGKESGIHSVSGSWEPSEKDEDKCSPACTQECQDNLTRPVPRAVSDHSFAFLQKKEGLINGTPYLVVGYITRHRTSELEEALELNSFKPLTLQMRKLRSKGLGTSRGRTACQRWGWDKNSSLQAPCLSRGRGRGAWLQPG